MRANRILVAIFNSVINRQTIHNFFKWRDDLFVLLANNSKNQAITLRCSVVRNYTKHPAQPSASTGRVWFCLFAVNTSVTPLRSRSSGRCDVVGSIEFITALPSVSLYVLTFVWVSFTFQHNYQSWTIYVLDAVISYVNAIVNVTREQEYKRSTKRS